MVCKREARRSVEIVFLPMQYSVSFSSNLNRFDLPFISASENQTFGQLNPSAAPFLKNPAWSVCPKGNIEHRC